MKKILKVTTAVAICLGVVGGAAVAASDHKGKKHRGHGAMHINFGDVDTDANGEISKDEIKNMRAARFAAADTDGDGFLSLTEMEAKAMQHAKDRSAKMLERMDANGDGKLAMDEMPERRGPGGRIFKRMDADNSGTISQAEFDEARAKMAERRKHHKSDD